MNGMNMMGGGSIPVRVPPPTQHSRYEQTSSSSPAAQQQQQAQQQLRMQQAVQQQQQIQQQQLMKELSEYKNTVDTFTAQFLTFLRDMFVMKSSHKTWLFSSSNLSSCLCVCLYM